MFHGALEGTALMTADGRRLRKLQRPESALSRTARTGRNRTVDGGDKLENFRSRGHYRPTASRFGRQSQEESRLRISVS